MQLSYAMQKEAAPIRYTRYRKEEVGRMTLLQLRDVCEQEKIIHAATNKMDREELIHLIMRFRGSRVPNLIKEHRPDGYDRVERALKKSKISEKPGRLTLPAKLVVYEGLDTNLFDGYSVPFDPELAGVNIAVMDKKDGLCGILNLEAFTGEEKLYITRSGKLPCTEAAIRDYHIYLFTQKQSDILFKIYEGEDEGFPSEMTLFTAPLLDFAVRRPVEAPMPLVIDFGTSNTTAGLYIDNVFYARISEGLQMSEVGPDRINYVEFVGAGGEKNPVLPTVIGVDRIEGDRVLYNVGYEAEKMVDSGYMSDGFSVFKDIKRWVSDYDAEEELTDYQGNRKPVARKEIVRAFLMYVVGEAQQRFKCKFTGLYLPFPVKQRERFAGLYQEAMYDYEIPDADMPDEGVSVLYSSIHGMMSGKSYDEGARYKALVIDCGGGTTDLSSCAFRIRNERVSYNIEIETSYENGDTDFGGNNLTYRIMQLLKVAAARECVRTGASVTDIAKSLDDDIFRLVDKNGAGSVYKTLETAYAQAEEIIPTRFKEYEFQSKDEYYKVKNNYYYLFSLAESVKKLFFSGTQILRIAVGSTAQGYPDPGQAFLFAARWKLSVRQKGALAVQKVMPTIMVDTALIRNLLKADIYEIISRFLEGLYEDDELSDFDIIKLTGQSCKIDLFRECIKEFIPGRLIQQKQAALGDYTLKLTCLDGAIRFGSDRRLGIARITITSKRPALPYVLSAFTHTGEKVILVHSLDRDRVCGQISRPLGSVELRLHLSDTQENEKYVYTVYCSPGDFERKTYEEIEELYGSRIPQDEVDTIENGEVRYFVWADGGQWGFSVVPVCRHDDEHLRIGKRQLFPFENESWINNFFDGMR